ncbi:MAG: permease [Chloroflexota bacterium]
MFVLGCLIFSLAKSQEKTRASLKFALMSFMRTLPTIMLIIILIGLLLGFIPPETISRFVGTKSGFWGVLLVALLGTILYVPSIIAFPLAASILRGGASVTAVAAFITTLTMLGHVTIPLEIKEMGKKMTLLRNVFSFAIALIISIIMGALL